MVPLYTIVLLQHMLFILPNDMIKLWEAIQSFAPSVRKRLVWYTIQLLSVSLSVSDMFIYFIDI